MTRSFAPPCKSFAPPSLRTPDLGQFADGDYESKVVFFFLHVKIFENLRCKIFTLTLVMTACFKKLPVFSCHCCSSNITVMSLLLHCVITIASFY